jgi:zinc protease
VLNYWPARDDADLRETLELDLLAATMQLMLNDELRERLGRSYSPSASSDLSSDFPGYGTLFAGGQVGFADIAATEAAISAIAARLRDTPISDDVLTRARAPILERSEASRRENGYWLSYLAHAASAPERLDRSRQALALMTAITAADIQRAAQRYLRDDRVLRVRVVHREGGAAPVAAPDVTASE